MCGGALAVAVGSGLNDRAYAVSGSARPCGMPPTQVGGGIPSAPNSRTSTAKKPPTRVGGEVPHPRIVTPILALKPAVGF
jgi:hypothetical protein